ncbi:MAG: glycoside hydrolase family 127 protein [Acidobacteria bacterium]|nr:glycoside hydrolase family 127 protein [Acidobacteriota bacterium]
MARLLTILAAAAMLFGCEVSTQAPPHPVPPVVAQKARPLPLSDVRLTGGPLRRAQDLDAQYLLSLEPDRMMAFLRKSAGLEPKAEGYNGWDGPGRQLTGHIAGHYLSAVSLMYAATGDARFKERADYLVRELKAVQDKQGDGYIGAQADRDGVDGKIRMMELSKGIIRSGGFDLNGLWSPWYVLHKIYAGLRDAYRLAGNREALEVEVRFAVWAERLLTTLDAGQTQRMLNTEFGGMNEIFVDLYADTGDKRWLTLADRFHHEAIVGPLARREDILAGKHGNTLVPKLIGSLARYAYTGRQADLTAAAFFWDQVALHHSFATGGHGRNEYFGEPGKLNDMVEGRTAETCNVYNMVKMARMLFALDPQVRYADFHERALFNHILGSIDPADGATCYMVPVGRGVAREYQNMHEDFTCCVGSGMESHALHADGLYFEAGDRLWVNLYVPSTAEWRREGVRLVTETDFPDGQHASLTLTMASPKTLTMALRRPWWAGEGFRVLVNGKAEPHLPPPGSYVELRREWASGDRIELTLPKALHLEPLPDNPARVAVMNGPLVLAGDLGPLPERMTGEDANFALRPSAPVFLAAGQPPDRWLEPIASKPGAFRTRGVGRDRDVDLVPFHQLHRRVYASYWDLYTPAQWKQHEAEVRAAEAKQRQLEAATVGFAQPGQMQAERDANAVIGRSSPVVLAGRHGRRASDYFSVDLPVDPSRPMVLVVTYHPEERANRSTAVLVDGTKVGEQAIPRISPQRQGEFFDVQYPIPNGLVAGKRKVTVRFEATGGNETPAVYGVRMVRR